MSSLLMQVQEDVDDAPRDKEKNAAKAFDFDQVAELLIIANPKDKTTFDDSLIY